MDKHRRRRGFLLFLAIEFLLFTGPFVLPMLQIAWAESQGKPEPQRFAYVPWMMGAGLVLLMAFLAWWVVRSLIDRPG